MRGMTRAPLLSVVLVALAIVLVVVALVRDGNNMWIALAGTACALAATVVATTSRRHRT
ncbi:hypothetical protein GCM10023340_45300 [Nocardioides marinquilinus]|uniref:Secreted protein n=2 Tax=Nocardioides marinquilinus TaxID=1210400 RepID=A0ABP9Q4B8_9ACTN